MDCGVSADERLSESFVGFTRIYTAANRKRDRNAEVRAAGKLKAIGRALAAIEFDFDGTIQTANENFLKVMGYSHGEIVGQHHRMFVDPSESGSASYSQFWQDLRAGQFKSSQYKRIGKGIPSASPIW